MGLLQYKKGVVRKFTGQTVSEEQLMSRTYFSPFDLSGMIFTKPAHCSKVFLPRPLMSNKSFLDKKPHFKDCRFSTILSANLADIPVTCRNKKAGAWFKSTPTKQNTIYEYVIQLNTFNINHVLNKIVLTGTEYQWFTEGRRNTLDTMNIRGSSLGTFQIG